MRRKDVAVTVIVTCLATAAALLHDHTIELVALLGAAAVGVAVIAWDVPRKPQKRPAGRLRVLTSPSSIRIPRSTSALRTFADRMRPRREAELSQRRAEERKARERDGRT